MFIANLKLINNHQLYLSGGMSGFGLVWSIPKFVSSGLNWKVSLEFGEILCGPLGSVSRLSLVLSKITLASTETEELALDTNSTLGLTVKVIVLGTSLN